jgi:phosphatidylglycerophosphatase A
MSSGGSSVGPDRSADLSVAERCKLLVATALGVGWYAPVAPGTFGSMVGVALAWGLGRAGGIPALALGTLCAAIAGFWSAGFLERRLNRVDPGPVVIDEVAGQMLTLLLVPPSPWVLVVGFFLFRGLDIWKPGPIRKLESLPGGAGIMADDLAAGAVGCLLMLGAVRMFPSLVGLP